MKITKYIFALLVLPASSSLVMANDTNPPAGPYAGNNGNQHNNLALMNDQRTVFNNANRNGSPVQVPEWVAQRDAELKQLIQKQNEMMQQQFNQQMERNRQYEEMIMQQRQQMHEQMEKNRALMQSYVTNRDGVYNREQTQDTNDSAAVPGQHQLMQPMMNNPGRFRAPYGQYPAYSVPRYQGFPGRAWR